MQYVAAIVATAPIRAENSHRSEMISQILFGEKALVMDKKGDFTKVKCIADHYEGWVQTTQLTEVTKHFVAKAPLGFVERNGAMVYLNETPMYISVGTPIYKVRQIGKFKVRYKKMRSLKLDYNSFNEDAIRELSLQFMNTSYLWGGRSSFGIDCSGFVQNVLKFFGKTLPRDASQQAKEGEVVGFLQATQCGDLAFFDNAEGNITHVGILLDPFTIIHSSGRVHIDSIDNEGIISKELVQRTHHLRIIKRF
ncbi:C40 family peptidase [Rhizosphaericola mali]|uniref:NlpC/P60 family protein n=1 Tax=Rhizosphaericola mali TaxID=2545455 RepID=A0A5P2G6F1_9BACT|nr:C40 family peptidase [Rhizosphaericola mali]QES89522.1 NlpC/P60 family protein [Rhizosphaericola mali]